MSHSIQINNRTYLWRVVLRSISVWAVVIAAESINGTIREALIVPRYGTALGRQISFAIALVLILAIALYFIRWIDAQGTYQLLVVGAVWAVLTFCFEVVLGRFIMGLAWERITADYDITQGGMMSFGLVYMLFAPMLASKLCEKNT
jgi:hypothetical protein